jgi:hypothetical protein
VRPTRGCSPGGSTALGGVPGPRLRIAGAGAFPRSAGRGGKPMDGTGWPLW